jgi:hypothetical protein
MKCIYIGDSGNISERVPTNHCSGDVEGSSFCKHVARAMGYPIGRMKRSRKNSTKLIITSTDSTIAKRNIKAYAKSGKWKFVLCADKKEAHDFQWYAIDRLNPKLNVDRRNWKQNQAQRYGQLLNSLIKCDLLDVSVLRHKAAGPGVYVHYNPIYPPVYNLPKTP